MLAWLMAGCGEEEPSQKMGLPVSICLPAGEQLAANHSPKHRVMGDPGTTEQFLPPHYVYLIVMKQEADDSWTVWDTVGRVLTDDDWEKKRYTGSLQSAGDTIYQYTEHVHLLIRNQRINGRVYAVASSRPLRFNQRLSTISSMDQLLNLSFDTSDTAVQHNLQHIYSTPYNYIVDSKYFGSFSNETVKSPYVNLMLYHVAAKVDIKWNVADDKRINEVDPSQAVRLTYMEARRLYNGNAYCFKPMRNEMASLPASGGYTIEDIVTPNDEGLWWEGRTYFYTIPYTVTGSPSYFPLQLLMGTNGTKATAAYELTLNQPIDTTAVFVPWLRGDFVFSAPLAAEAVTKTVGE
jgi:hypothetical protein